MELDVAPWQQRSLMVRWGVGSILQGGPKGVPKAVVCAILSLGVVHVK